MSNKPRVVFTFVDAGFGHIMIMDSIYNSFVKKYKDEFEIIKYTTYAKDNPKAILRQQRFIKHNMIWTNHSSAYGHVLCWFTNHLPPKVSAFLSFTRVKKEGTKTLEALNADLLVSDHFLIQYLASRMKSNTYRVAINPDNELYPVYTYPCDLYLTSYLDTYQIGLKKYPDLFNENNYLHIPYCARGEVFNTSKDKYENRKNLNLPVDKFTVIFLDGSYATGRSYRAIKKLANKGLNMTIILIAGRNEKIQKRAAELKHSKETSIISLGYVDNPVPYLASSDLFIGKGGACSIYEADYFNLPMIIDRYSFTHELKNAKAFPNAIVLKHSWQAAHKIEYLYHHQDELNKLRELSKKSNKEYNPDKVAEIIYQNFKKHINSHE